MSPTELADFVATHLWVTLLSITSVMVLLAWFGWYALHRWGNRLVAPGRGGIEGTPPVVSNVSQFVRRLGIQALLSAAFAVFASMVFFEIADEIGADEDLGQFDM